jgi:muramoyltetrapeptide carboxypeptidase LdcA involved in peptidoglycan recycling
MPYKKPERLKPGDTVGVVSPSWGGPSCFPLVYENGLKTLRGWGLKIKEYPSARRDAAFLRANPKFRAGDINAAFSDPEVKAVISSIGGNDSVRILPFLDKAVLSGTPKILMGYSDTTTLHVYLNLLGVTSLYGPSVMAGLSQAENLPAEYREHVRRMLFEPAAEYAYSPYKEYSEGYPDWGKAENVGKVSAPRANAGWGWLQGDRVVSGELFGGCLEVLEMLKGTEFWPSRDFWRGKVLFLETSEDKPPLWYIDQVLRNYGMLGVLENISGLIFSRPMRYSEEEKTQLEQTLLRLSAKEFSRPDLPIVSNFDIGHTDPQLVLPMGIRAELNPAAKSVKLIESWLV